MPEDYNLPVPQHQIHTVCTHDCPDSCGVLVTVDELTGRAMKVQGDPAHPVTRGFLCGKVARYLERVYSPERLLYPMRRKPGVHGLEARQQRIVEIPFPASINGRSLPSPFRPHLRAPKQAHIE